MQALLLDLTYSYTMLRSSAHVLAENIKRLRNTAGKPRTQEEIGQAAGIDQSTVGRILAARNNTQVDKLDALAEAFSCQPYELLMPGFDPNGPFEVPTLSAAAAELAVAYDSLPNEKRALLMAIAKDMVAATERSLSRKAVEIAEVFDSMSPTKQQLLFAVADEMSNKPVTPAPAQAGAPTAPHSVEK